jgi:hypothetical protein
VSVKYSDPGIVADGKRRLREAKDYLAMRKLIFAEVVQRHEEERKHASFWRLFWLELMIQREVAAELKKEFPPNALHIAAAEK